MIPAQAWFVAGTIPLVLAGGLHAAAAVLDSVRPTFFTPVDVAARHAAGATGIRLRRMFPRGNDTSPSMWKVWLGMHISHGLGVCSVGLLCLLIATYDFTLVERIAAIRPLVLAFSATYLALSFRFWLYGPAIVCGIAASCFAVSTVLSA